MVHTQRPMEKMECSNWGGAWGAEGQGGVEKCEDVILFHEKEDPIMNLIYNKQNCHQVSMAIHCI